MQKIIKLTSSCRQLLETANFAFMKFFDSLVKIAGQIYDFLHFKGCSYLNHKTSFNLSVQVATFLVFDNPFMMLLDIFMPVLDHALMLDNFLITSKKWHSKTAG